MATTINTYSVGLTLDAADYINKSALSAQETRRLSRAIEEARSPADKYSREVDRLTKAVETGGISLETYSRLLESAGKKYGFVGQDAKAAADAQERLAKVMKDGEAVTKSVMTAQERHTAELKRLSDLYKQGAISAETYKRAVVEAGGAETRANQLKRDAVSVTQSVVTAEEKHSAAINKIERLYQAGAISAQTYQRAINAEQSAFNALNPELQKHNRMIEEGKRVTLSLLSPMEKHSRELAKLNTLHRAGAVDNVTYRRAVEQANNALKQQTQVATKASSSVSGVGSQIKTLVAGYVGIQTITKSIKLAIDAEQAAASFEVLTGSANNAAFVLEGLREFSDVSPLSFSGVQDAAKTLLGFNVPVEQVMGSLKMLGDVSMGNEERFKSLTLAFAQVSASGKLTGGDLLQFVNAGFNPLQEISKRTGESMLELRDRMSQGAIAASEVVQAFADATGEGGKFNGMTEKLADTMGGKLAISMANLEKAGIQLGNALAPLIISMTDGFDKSSSTLDGMVFLVEKFADGIGFIMALLKDTKNLLAEVFLGQEALASGEANATNKFLDSLDQRDRERAAAAAEAGKKELDVQAAIAAAAENPIDVTAAFEDKMAALQAEQDAIEKGAAAVAELNKATEEAENRKKMAAEGYTAEQIAQIENQEKLNASLLKTQEDEKKRIKELENLRKASEEAFTKDVEQSLAAAQNYFEQQKQQSDAMRREISQGIGGDFESDSAEAFKFFADQTNANIGAAAIPELPTPGEKEIIDKAKELFLEEQKARAEQHKQQLEAAKQVRAAILENGFQRIR